MKKVVKLKQLFALLYCFLCLFSTACVDSQESIIETHTHNFSLRQIETKYLKIEATCQHPAVYYYSCECGECGSETFDYGAVAEHCYIESVDDIYLKQSANCEHEGEYYKTCSVCGFFGDNQQTFFTRCLGHDFSMEIPSSEYIKSEATSTSGAVYYKTCSRCNSKGTETFVYGQPINDYSEEEKQQYTPKSLTMSIYDTTENEYGFTCNTQKAPILPVFQIAEGNSLMNGYKEYPVKVSSSNFYSIEDNSIIDYYIIKTEIKLKPLTKYTYRIYDKAVGVGTNSATFTTNNFQSNSFKFAHVSDSQVWPSSGEYFNKVLSKIVGKNDFIIHTGDVVEYSKYEAFWLDMLNGNYEYLSKIPVMAISGNHETTYRNGSHETFKHFNNKIPSQESTELGYFYSFVYGNVKFIMLNTNSLYDNMLKNEQYEWLINELQNNTCDWTIVCLHNPLYSVGVYGSNPSRNYIALSLQRQLQSVFAEYGVDIVLQGHDHTISRTFPLDANGEPTEETIEIRKGIKYSLIPSGVIYVMNGPAGTQTRVPVEGYNESLYKYALSSNACSWAEFEVNGNSLTVSVKYTDGNMEYSYCKWGIYKPFTDTCDSIIQNADSEWTVYY